MMLTFSNSAVLIDNIANYYSMHAYYALALGTLSSTPFCWLVNWSLSLCSSLTESSSWFDRGVVSSSEQRPPPLMLVYTRHDVSLYYSSFGCFSILELVFLHFINRVLHLYNICTHKEAVLKLKLYILLCNVL